MKTKHYTNLKIIFILVLAGMFSVCRAQEELVTFVKNVNAFNKLFPQEKVYLHFDNTGYFRGENIWFKAYVVSGPFHQPTEMSGVLYVELVSPEGRVVQSYKAKVVNGQAHGRLQLANIIHSGYYEVRAYTRVMLNWDESGIFSRVFPIYDQPKTTAEYLEPKMTVPIASQKIPEERPKPESTPKKMNMDFYPEGGHLVQGLLQVVACKIYNKEGAGVNIKGNIVDENDSIIGSFQTNHQGIGTFKYCSTTKPAKAVFTIDKDKYSFSLPKAEPDGYAMTVTEGKNDLLNLTFERTASQKEDNVGLAATSGGNAFIFQEIHFNDDGQAVLSIEKAALKEGVNQFILFTDEGRPLCQRMVFKRPTTHLNFSGKFDKEEYKPYEKINLEASLTDDSGQPVQSVFSISVRDIDTNLPGSHPGNAITNLLLSSDLKGYIEDIDYYFEADDEVHNKALDNLMLTQGWYRYKWEQMAQLNDFKITHRIEEGLIISGRLANYFRRSKAKSDAKINVYLYDKEHGRSMSGTAISDSLGLFNFLADDFEGRWQMTTRTLDPDKNKRKEMDVQLNRMFTPDSRPYEPLDTWMFRKTYKTKKQEEEAEEQTAEEDYTKGKNKYENLLPNVTITATKRWMQGKALEVANIVYDLEEERTREDDTGEYYLETIWDYLLRTNKYFDFDVDSNANKIPLYKHRPVQFIVDGKDHSLIDIQNLNAKEIEAILISDKTGVAYNFLAGTERLDSITSATTDAGNIDSGPGGDGSSSVDDMIASGQELDNTVLIFIYLDKNAVTDRKGERNTVVQGFTKYIDFYSPDYSDVVMPNEQDFRRTLYWNPYVVTDKSGKAKVSFFNSQQCTQMEVDAMTVTPNGFVGVMKEEYEK